MTNNKYVLTVFTEDDKKFYDPEHKIFNRKVLIQIQDLLRLPGIVLESITDGEKEDLTRYIKQEQNHLVWIDKKVKFRPKARFNFVLSLDEHYISIQIHEEKVKIQEQKIRDLRSQIEKNSSIAIQAQKAGLSDSEIEEIRHKNAGNLADKNASHAISLQILKSQHDKEMTKIASEHQQAIEAQKASHQAIIEKYKTDKQSKTTIIGIFVGLLGVILGLIIKPLFGDADTKPAVAPPQRAEKPPSEKGTCRAPMITSLSEPCRDELHDIFVLATGICGQQVADCISLSKQNASLDNRKCKDFQKCAEKNSTLSYGRILKTIDSCVTRLNGIPDQAKRVCD